MKPSRLSDKHRLRLRDLFKAYPAFVPIYQNVQALCALLNHKNQTKRQCRPLAFMLLDFI
jgi:hypothetical protein